MTTALDTGIVARIQVAPNPQDLDAVASELADDVVFHPPREWAIRPLLFGAVRL